MKCNHNERHELLLQCTMKLPNCPVAKTHTAHVLNKMKAVLQYTGYNRVSGRVTSTPGPDVSHISGTWLVKHNTCACSLQLATCFADGPQGLCKQRAMLGAPMQGQSLPCLGSIFVPLRP